MGSYMTDQQLDTYLKLWAVIGPLIAAAASAVWARHIQNSDRRYERTQEIEHNLHKVAIAEKQAARNERKEKYEELKRAFSDFMASTHEYVRKESLNATNSTPATQKRSLAAYDKLTYSSQLVMLLGDKDVESAAIDFWNATSDIPRPYDAPIDDDYKAKIHTYKAARASFNEVAKKYLAKFEEQ